MKNNGENNLQFHVFLLIFLSPSRSVKNGDICVSGKKELQRLQLGCLQLINKFLYRLPPNQHNLVLDHFSQSRMMPKNSKCKCDCTVPLHYNGKVQKRYKTGNFVYVIHYNRDGTKYENENPKKFGFSFSYFVHH